MIAKTPAAGSLPHSSGAPTAPLLVKPAQAAAMLAISPRKLWSLTNCGEIPCVRIGTAVRYSPADLEAWIAEQKQSC